MIKNYSEDLRLQVLELLDLNTPEFFDPEERAEFEAYLDHEKEDYFVYVEGDQIIGVGGINYFPEEKTARIAWDMIHPDHHGKGIGSKLTQHRIDCVKQHPLGYTRIIVRTSQLAYKFYEKMGFRLVEITENYWAEGYHLYLMEHQDSIGN